MKIKQILLSAALIMGAGVAANAQVKVGDNPTTINPNSILEMESTNKGMLLPRVALTGTANVAPLAAHVAGMTVYNTATASDVTPGYYYSDGAKWVRVVGGTQKFVDGTNANTLTNLTEDAQFNATNGSFVKFRRDQGQLDLPTQLTIGLTNTSSANVNAVLDFHADNSDRTTYEARIFRQGGLNSSLHLIQTGTGAFQFNVNSNGTGAVSGTNMLNLRADQRAQLLGTLSINGANATTAGFVGANTYLTHNTPSIASGTTGRTVLVNNRGVGTGGFDFVNTNDGVTFSTGMSISSVGNVNTLGTLLIGSIPAGASSDDVLTTSATGAVRKLTTAELLAAMGGNIYTQNGTLTSARTITTGGFRLNIAGTAAGTNAFTIDDGRLAFATEGAAGTVTAIGSMNFVANSNNGPSTSINNVPDDGNFVWGVGATTGGGSVERMRLGQTGNLTLTGTGYVKLTAGTTAERPGVAELQFGMIRYNSTIGRGEMYVNDVNGDGTQGDAGWRAI